MLPEETEFVILDSAMLESIRERGLAGVEEQYRAFRNRREFFMEFNAPNDTDELSRAEHAPRDLRPWLDAFVGRTDTVFRGGSIEALVRAMKVRDDLRLAGVVASVVIESELLAFLSGLPREAPGPVRNGYARRCVRTVDGVMPFLSARERSGRFEPQLVARYARSTRIAPADLLDFATAEGYSSEELRRLLSNAYVASGAVPERLDDILARTRGRLAPWVAAPAEGCPRLVAGWLRHVRHETPEGAFEKFIAGAKLLDASGALSGVLAVAGAPDEGPAVVRRLIALIGGALGVRSPAICAAPAEEANKAHETHPEDAPLRSLFAQAAREAWPGVELL